MELIDATLGNIETAISETTSRFGYALGRWIEVLGADFAIVDSSSLAAAETATFSTTQSIPAILRPANASQVQECLRIANQFRIPVYPISTGKNRGYGSRVPVAGSSVLLDLGRMNQIVDFSEELAYVTVEPGVTQGQLHEFLRARGSRLWLDATGAGPDCSLIGNVMERGFGHTPYGDHFAHVCGFEVILPSGEITRTGFARFPNAQSAAVYKWGVGPALDGLFSQSSLGIVTRMTIWLMPAPPYFQAFFFQCNEDRQLAPLIEALRPLRLNGVLRSAVHIANDYKVLSSLQQYPWQETAGSVPLCAEAMLKLRQRLKFGAWSASGGLYGTRTQVAEARRLLRQALKGKVERLQFLDDRRLSLATRFAKPYRLLSGWDLRRTLELVRPVYGLLQGIPTGQPLASCYWRKKTPPPSQMDPDRDGCGLLWCAPVAPLEGDHAARMTHLAAEILLAHGFEPAISLTLITERSLCCVVSISYDRHEAEQDERAMACYKHLLEALTEHGYYSYRLGIQAMSEFGTHDGYGGVLQTIKKALDPNGILAPGRYQVA